jgi:hypothetical protein
MKHLKGPFLSSPSFANPLSLSCSFTLFIWSFKAFSNHNMSSFDWNLFINEPDAEVVANLAKGTREKVQEARGSFLRLASGALPPRGH